MGAKVQSSGGVATFGCCKHARSFTAIDPGVTYHGRAEFCDGRLFRVAYVSGLTVPPVPRSGLGIVEKPVVYPRLTKNARTVAELAFSAGVVLGQFAVRLHVEPRVWKGTTDGDVFVRRVRRYAESVGDLRVFNECLAGVPACNWEHALDAYALGQWCLGVEL